MRPYAFLAAALTIASGVIAVDQMKSVIIWTDKPSVTDDMIDKARKAIEEAKGKITHIYNMQDAFRGFAAVAPEQVLKNVKAMEGGNEMNVDEDRVVSG
ncbi:hypothetical protein CkaCkLH20_04056 [Colletotrichum karsti]|uniref:Inhibitor I9 domain-containing protein n=1 Tax=Colletotrichum karsti TaxID=1095194 RepID=A0A9P6LJP0_9PEZI|nr:uncharacterized protein CkaCkLH20_04056 [Colletotrichum karsti]KAF9878564.1 hypothetical protein CkaCkLH20_04056 [Colletotrichum karsti]